MTPTTTFSLRIAVPAPLRKLFDYLPPADLSAPPQPGARLRVPFGSRTLTGVLVERAEVSAENAGALKPAEALLDLAPLIDSSTQSLCRWASDYYQHPIGEVFSAALPKRLREGKALPHTHWQLTPRGKGLPEGALARAKSQAKALAMLQQGPAGHQQLREAGISSAVLKQLRDKELITRCAPVQRAMPADSPILRQPELSLESEQQWVRDAISSQTFACHLLQGVTGSGKTEIYLQLIRACLERGQQALVLIPEIGLTPQTLARFEARFARQIAVLHSGLGDAQRLAAWQAAQSGSADIVIGTRSAIFTPLANLGLLIVDEEHDSSYKQQDGFRYSARDVAVKRAQLERCPVLLGSATPSLESLSNAQQGRYQSHQLRQRRGGGEMPSIETVDLRGLALSAGVSDYLRDALKQTVELDGKQALLFLNRRGYAPTLQCHQCGWVAGCEHCDARMTVHLRKRSLQCHHCASRRPLLQQCPDCHSTALMAHGLGTEQTEAYLRSVMKCPVHRIDSDAMRGPEAMQSLLDIATQQEPCVILGTQMLTKGHHFPAVQLVGVIDADALMYSADFRGEERMAQLLVQVSGRAGRESGGGRVIVQTHYPDEALFAALADTDYGQLSQPLLDRRRAQCLPPFGQLSLLRADARDEVAAERFLRQIREQALPGLPTDSQLIGPLPSAMSRRAGRFRWQLWCLTHDRASARRAAEHLVLVAESHKQHRDLNWFLDVDPQEVS
ncbi:MAG: primosomal protein N' [Congregibacter sp.]